MSSAGFTIKGALLRLVLRAVSATWRVCESVPADCRGVIDGSERGIIAFWHGRMFPIWYRFRGRGASALISGSRDGELLAGYLGWSLGYREVIRGSTSKGGSRALDEIAGVLERRTLLITPDGPRGPAHEAKPGALIAAARSGYPLVLAGWTCGRAIRFRSWDSMAIPYPFSKVYFRYCKFALPINLTSNSAEHTTQAAQQGTPAPSKIWIDDATLARFNAALRNDEGAPER